MLKSVQWDIYTFVIVALVPTLLLAAWGLHAYDSSQLHRRQCEVAVEWLESGADYVEQFEQAGTTGRTQMWISGIEQLDSPNAAGILRTGVLRSAHYHADHIPNLSTSEPGVLNPRNGLFERQIAEGTERLAQHCPETADLIPTAFPMVFREDET